MKNSLLALFLSLMTLGANGQKLHAFIFCNTEDERIGFSAKINYANVYDYFQRVAFLMKYQFKDYTATGINFRTDYILEKINSATIATDDIVVLYFNTHGEIREDNQTIFPTLKVPKIDINAYNQFKKLLEKKTSFLLGIIEACSSYKFLSEQQGYVMEQGAEMPLPNFSPQQIKYLKNLFISPCRVIVTAANRGKPSFATNFGSTFTNCLLKTITEYLDIKEDNSLQVTWNNVLQQARKYTYEASNQIAKSTTPPREPYFPIWERRGCTNVVLQGTEDIILDTGYISQRAVEFNVNVTRTSRIRNPYTVDLFIKNNSGLIIDSVVYYLHNTFKEPVVTSTMLKTNYFYRLFVWGTFPLKAKIYFSDGVVEVRYQKFNF